MYSVFDSFPQGVDRTRPIFASPAGTLWTGKNGHLSRGGDFEQRKAFPVVHTLPVGTWGLLYAGGKMYVFGSEQPGLMTMPAGITYQQLAHPNGAAYSAMVDLLSVEAYSGKPYAVAQFADGGVYHYYDGTCVGAWVNGVVQPYNNSASAMAANLVAIINTDGTWTAAVVGGGVFTIEHNTTNTAFTIEVTAEDGGGDDTEAIASSQLVAAGVGVKQKEQVTVSGTMTAGDRLTVKLGTKYFGARYNPPSPVARIVRTFGRKVYAAAGSILNYSGVDTATGWDREMNSGAGFVTVSTHDGGAEDITAMARYLQYLAVFTDKVTQIWSVAADDTNNEPIQTMPNTGCVAQRGAIQFGDQDTFFVSYSGIRSIRSRAQVNLAGVNDVGTPIDTLVVEDLKTLTDAQRRAICSVVEPTDGRLWLAIKDRIYVFSYFPSKKVSGWTWYEPGFSPEWFAVKDSAVYVREGNNVRLYGGINGDEYDSAEVDCVIPFFVFGKAGTPKSLVGFDVATVGQWQATILVNPNDESEYVDIGTLDGVTFGMEDIAAVARSTHFGMRLRRSQAGAASVSATAIYYLLNKAEA